MPAAETALPAFGEDLAETLVETWRLLRLGAADPASALHLPVLASLRADGAPAARTVVLRAVDETSRSLRIHTDRRSAKCGEIDRDPRVVLHFYDPDRLVQLRMDCSATLHCDDALADRAWIDNPPATQALYRVAPGPGVPIDAAECFDAKAAEDGRGNFAAIVAGIERLDWLHLAPQGHRRARFDWADGRLRATWLVP
jgi:pyridoxamine 5'-phosphate oxidase